MTTKQKRRFITLNNDAFCANIDTLLRQKNQFGFRDCLAAFSFTLISMKVVNLFDEKNTLLTMRTLTLLMYLQPQPGLHPQISELQSQLFASSVKEEDGSDIGSGSGSAIHGETSVKPRFVIFGYSLPSNDDSKCGDRDCIRGKSISMIVTRLFFARYFV